MASDKDNDPTRGWAWDPQKNRFMEPSLLFDGVWREVRPPVFELDNPVYRYDPQRHSLYPEVSQKQKPDSYAVSGNTVANLSTAVRSPTPAQQEFPTPRKDALELAREAASNPTQFPGYSQPISSTSNFISPSSRGFEPDRTRVENGRIGPPRTFFQPTANSPNFSLVEIAPIPDALKAVAEGPYHLTYGNGEAREINSYYWPALAEIARKQVGDRFKE